jgi:zinc protease
MFLRPEQRPASRVNQLLLRCHSEISKMPHRYKLSNGITVISHAQTESPVVAFQVWVKVGSADEQPNEIGLAHLHEHMLFKGTQKRALGEIAQSIEAHGGEINAWTSFDQTVYHVVMAKSHAEVGLDVLSDAVRNSAFDPGELTREIEVVCEEMKRSIDMPSRRASKQLFAQCYQVHPYGRPVIGFESNVRAHSRERVLDFYQKHYRPENTVLSCVGDFEEGWLRHTIEKYFGGTWSQSAAPMQHSARVAEPAKSKRNISVVTEDVKEAHLHCAFPIGNVAHADSAALDVLSMILGQGESSLLNLAVKKRRSLCRDVSAWAWTPSEPGLMALSLMGPASTIQEAFDASLDVLTFSKVHLIETSEVETVKALIESQAIFQRETAQGLARKFGFYETVMGGFENESEYYKKVAQVTPTQLREVAGRVFNFDIATVASIVPNGTALTESEIDETLSKKRTPADLNEKSRSFVAPHPLKRSAAREGISTHVLSNGVTLIVKEERHNPLFSIRAVVPGGLRVENDSNNGISTLLARTWPRGTASLSAQSMSQELDRLAASISAVGGRNTVSLRGEFLSKHFDRAFELFAETWRAPRLEEDDVKREQQLQLQDLTSREDKAASLAFEAFSKAIYREHPYARNTLGEKSSVESLSARHLKEFHGSLIAGVRTFAVVGDVDTDAVLDFMRLFTQTGSSEPISPPMTSMLTPLTTSTVVKRIIQKAQSHIVYGFLGCTIVDPDRLTLEVIQTVLSGQSGRLFLELRDKRSMAYSVSANSTEGIDAGHFSVYIGTSPEKVDQAIAGIQEQLARLKVESVLPSELSRAKEYLIGTQAIGLQRNSARAGTMALDVCYGLGAEHHLGYAERLQTLTAQDLMRVANRVFDFERSALSVVGT